ncbi:universal stress protein [Leisingera sp. JC1]|uniref:universal stress protein n=1 Tax=Leisingera sp. JC1 TaxID=1855282 RepID=UPI000802A479|nr:universal stress protein [Leisingera sp. JC1]NVK13580.1 universal stress protein [Paracoccaceae bacterium]OBY26346.1 universal stress protein [Leisingera sp. JC1]
MYSNILVALSLEHGISEQALSTARALLSEGGKITAAHIHEPPNKQIMYYMEQNVVEKSYQKAQASLADRLQGEADVNSVILESQSAGRAITEYANKHKIDCIVLASHKPGMKEFFLGSTAALVVRHAHCSVHVLRL